MLKQNESNVYKLHSDTRLGSVHLTVPDLAESLAYYLQSVGLRVQWREGDSAMLGVGGQDLLALTEKPGAKYVPRRTGLYHFAIRVPSRADLAGVLWNLIRTETPIQGMSDHLVSEAIYLTDPHGNGIEIYRDRPSADWRYENDELRMDTLPLNYRALLAERENDPAQWSGLPHGTVLGHMHLHVASIPETEAFYQDQIGFDRTASIGGSASFFSAGGYHHHLGANTWNGVGAPPPPPDSTGLRYFTVILAEHGEIARLAERLSAGGTVYEERPDGLFVRDPSRNGILFTVESAV